MPVGYIVLKQNDLKEETLSLLNMTLRQHVDELNRLAGLNGTVQITSGLNVGSNKITAGSLNLGVAQVLTGNGSPEGRVSAPPGSMYLNLQGGTGTSLFVKESGVGPTGWSNTVSPVDGGTF